VAGARGENAGVVKSILFGLGGLLIGLGAALLFSKLAYAAQRSKGAGVFYMTVPWLFCFSVLAATAYLSSSLARLIQ